MGGEEVDDDDKEKLLDHGGGLWIFMLCYACLSIDRLNDEDYSRLYSEDGGLRCGRML